MLFSPTCNAPRRVSAPRKEVWDCARLLTKLRLLTLHLETPLTPCALKSDTATEGIKTGVIIHHLQSAIDALDIMVLALDVAEMGPDDINQSSPNERINAQNMTNWRNEALPPERVHLQAYSAKGCGHEISLVPSKTLDTYLSPSEFVNTVSRRLGGQQMDAQGSHCLSCMAGGDATTQHNAVRDVNFDFCERAGLRLISEAPNILLDIFTRDGRCRPADILSIPALALAQVLPSGATAIRTEPICLDIAVLNALGQDHWRHTAVRQESAADITAQLKLLATTLATSAAGRHGQGCGRGHEGNLRCCGEKGEHGRGDGARGVHGPPGGGDYSHRDEGGAKTSDEEAQCYLV